MIKQSGNERFRSFSRAIYRGTHVLIFVFDSGNETSFEPCVTLFKEAREHNSDINRFCLVAQKSDVKEGAMSPAMRERARSFAASNGMAFFEVSAKTQANVEQLLQTLDAMALMPSADAILHRKRGAQKACAELQRMYEEDSKCFAGVWVPRDVVTLLCRAVEQTSLDPCWGDPPRIILQPLERPRRSGCWWCNIL